MEKEKIMLMKGDIVTLKRSKRVVVIVYKQVSFGKNNPDAFFTILCNPAYTDKDGSYDVLVPISNINKSKPLIRIQNGIITKISLKNKEIII